MNNGGQINIGSSIAGSAAVDGELAIGGSMTNSSGGTITLNHAANYAAIISGDLIPSQRAPW